MYAVDEEQDGGIATLSAIDELIGARIRPEPWVRRIDAGRSAYITNTETLKVGTVAVPSSISKILQIPHTELVPQTPAIVWVFGVADVGPGVNETGLLQLVGSLVLAPGVTITAVRARVWKQGAGDLVRVALFRSASGVATNLTGFVTLGTAGAWLLIGGLLSEVVSSTASYVLYAELQNAATGAIAARLANFEIDYTMPSYDKAM